MFIDIEAAQDSNTKLKTNQVNMLEKAPSF